VLEAGCGRAHFSVAAGALGYRAEALDYAPEVVERVQKRFPQLPVFAGDVRNLPDTPDGAYDAVYSPGVCEHFEDGPEPILAETRRILKPGGVLLLSTPCFNAFRRAVWRLGGFRRAPEGEFYQYAFSPREMTEILERTGFEVVEVRLHGALKTLRDHVPGLARIKLGPLEKPLAVLLDVLPVTSRWGHACVWVARKR
jgi:SAM-dependent methyltransferase